MKPQNHSNAKAIDFVVDPLVAQRQKLGSA